MKPWGWSLRKLDKLSLKDVQKIIGLLESSRVAVAFAPVFFVQFCELAKKYSRLNPNVRTASLSTETLQEIEWWLSLDTNFLCSLIWEDFPPDLEIFTDASLSLHTISRQWENDERINIHFSRNILEENHRTAERNSFGSLQKRMWKQISNHARVRKSGISRYYLRFLRKSRVSGSNRNTTTLRPGNATKQSNMFLGFRTTQQLQQMHSR
ncbi:unnamed protein product [Lepeophtheirus salmonis]|uniref:(salmon louse) hypothetical protein n=1 Tax=Lepeophtheirus salmonis TaxID=72036 RepID=A0A7R8CWJ5_LEPSM|nr:unnamed protein product [Lepeophtheirus salmonis]CAF2953590.1 unnamed protein product [Lepeophtheirus salmonis]